MISYMDKERGELIFVAQDEWVYSIPVQGDYVVTLRAIMDGVKVCAPGVKVLGQQVELPRILSSRGIALNSFKGR